MNEDGIHMPAAKYDAIYKSLRQAIEAQEYVYGGTLPSEHQLVAKYDCSRNTVRRAIAQLAEEGYVQSVHGKGVPVHQQTLRKERFRRRLGKPPVAQQKLYDQALQKGACRNARAISPRHTPVSRQDDVTVYGSERQKHCRMLRLQHGIVFYQML